MMSRESVAFPTFEFAEVPEVPIFGIPYLLRHLMALRRQRVANTGAYVVRKAGRDVANYASLILTGTPLYYTEDGHFTLQHSVLHQDDKFSGFALTEHYTEGSQLQFVSLTNTSFFSNQQPDYTNPDVNAKFIFDNGFVGVDPSRLEKYSKQAVATVINDGDLLFFDQRHPHAFSNIGGEDRNSWNRYINDSNRWDLD